MKIGIATFHQADNYGAVIQAYALQSFLQACGHKVQIVDFRPHIYVSWVRRWLAKSPKVWFLKWEQQWKRRLFEKFRCQHIERTSEIFNSIAELQEIVERFDLLISGSDQVWNPRWLDQVDGYWDFFFLRFAGVKTRRISYAASIGHSDLSTLTGEWQKKLAEGIKTIDAISVREPSGVELVYQLCGRKDAVCVADPTLLLDRTHYDQLSGAPVRRDPYFFSFMLHGLEQDAQVACQFVAEQLRLRMVQCDATKTSLHAGYILPSPEGWLRAIRDAQYVVTNSFHCTVLCLIFHVPFAAVLIDGEIGSMNSRITDLLNMIGLKGRIVLPGAEILAELVLEEIDWESVDRKLTEARNNAISFLATQGLCKI